ncbi:COBRA-like protein 10 [Pyrus x bretschneideri]|uniref:COBRA-like protein 10 n=1 Tax=Pyrus x bretschneideri TaxID=225117 RepID=UPI00051148D8|nr:COBRA-like protein 10 [Pyrus x bretschneideri]
MMETSYLGTKMPWRSRTSFFHAMLVVFLVFSCFRVEICYGQDEDAVVAAPPPEQEDCDGIFLSYTFTSREKLLPHLKNVSAQAWAFKSEASILNAGSTELKAWKMYIGFQHREILVAAEGAQLVDGGDMPAEVGSKGAYFAGYPMTDLKTMIDTAGDYTQIQAKIAFKGTQFGMGEKSTPMPKSIAIVNDGFKCPAAKFKGKTAMSVCCKKDPKFKAKKVEKTKFMPRQNGDLSITYDILQTYTMNYLAQVTIDNVHPLGRLDHWNLTWEWMRGEFINTMRGAYTHKKDTSECLYGQAGKFYKDLDFSQVMNCEKRPVIADLPAERKDDPKVGKLPRCCRNGTILPGLMDKSQSQSIFQLQVYKIPPDDNRTAITPPQQWKISGVLNPTYRCGPPIRVDPTQFPDPSGLQATSDAIASWQVVCNITKPKVPRCCVSFSAYYSTSVVPCSTCACGCKTSETDKCNPRAPAMLLPAEALLVPFANRTVKAKAWAKLKHYDVPKKLPCPDNCGVSLNWHIDSDYSNGWTARLTLFNWGTDQFQDWYTAVKMNKAYQDYENVYSFNGTRMEKDVNNTILFTGLKGLNYLMGIKNGTDPKKNPMVPGKQQSVISFKKKHYHNIDIKAGQGFPTRVLFNGEECALPKVFPKNNAGHLKSNALLVLCIAIMSFLFMTDRFH